MAQPLQPAVVPVVFGKLDTKTAPRLAQQGTLLEMVNCQMTQGGRIQKRPGYASIGKGAGVTTGQGLTSLNSELVALASNKVWGYSPLANTWTSKGDWSYCQPSVDGVANTQSGHKNTDVAIGGGLACYVWEDLAGIAYYSVFDVATGQAVVPATVVVTGGFRPRVAYMTGYFCIFYDEANALKVRQFTVSAPGTLSTAVQFAGTMSQIQLDAKAFPLMSRIAVAYNSSNNIAVLFYDPISGTATGPYVSVVFSLATAVFGWLEDDARDGLCFLGIHLSNAGQVAVITFDFSGAFLLAETITFAAPAGVPTQMTGHIDRTTSPLTKHLLWHTNLAVGGAADTYADFLARGTFQTGTGATIVTSLVRSVGLVSRTFLVNGTPHAVVAYDGKVVAASNVPIQQTYYVINALTGVVVCKFLSTLGGGMRTDPCGLSSVPLLSGSTYAVSVTRKVQIAAEGTAASPTTIVLKAVARAYLNFAEPARSTPSSLAQSAYLPGGTVRRYDGASSPEQGFNYYPEAPALTSGGAGNLANGVYQYVVVYTEFDKFGNVHRSGVSTPTSFGPGAGAFRVNVAYTFYRLTSKSNVIVEIYRRDVTTGTDTTNFYKVTSISTPILNSTTTDGGTFQDNLSTADKEIREPLYTSGGVLMNDGPPPARVMTVHRDRLVLGGLDVPNRLLPSKPAVPDQGLAFSNTFMMATDPTDGDTTALESMDDKLIDFHANAIYWYSGDGPNVLGQGSYSAPVRLPGNVGTMEPESVAVSDKGIMFASSGDGGLYLLGRDLSLSYIGADVERFNATDISAAISIPVLNQTRFYSASGTTQVRDEYYQRWYTWTNQQAVGATVFGGVVTFIGPDGTVYQETPGLYGDAGEPILQKLTMAPLSPFAPGGWGRLWELQLIGDYQTPHIVKVGLSYDHTGYFWEELTIDAAAACSGETYGASATYGSSTFGGILPGDYRFSVRPRLQRFSAVGITIQEVIADGNLGAGLDLSALTLLIGAQPGSLAKLPAARMMATT